MCTCVVVPHFQEDIFLFLEVDNQNVLFCEFFFHFHGFLLEFLHFLAVELTLLLESVKNLFIVLLASAEVFYLNFILCYDCLELLHIFRWLRSFYLPHSIFYALLDVLDLLQTLKNLSQTFFDLFHVIFESVELRRFFIFSWLWFLSSFFDILENILVIGSA